MVSKEFYLSCHASTSPASHLWSADQGAVSVAISIAIVSISGIWLKRSVDYLLLYLLDQCQTKLRCTGFT